MVIGESENECFNFIFDSTSTWAAPVTKAAASFDVYGFPCISGSIWSEGISRNTWSQRSKGKKRICSWSGKQWVEGRKERGNCLFSLLPLSQVFIPERTRELRALFFSEFWGLSFCFFLPKEWCCIFYAIINKCSSFDINQLLLSPSSSHFPLLLHGFVLKQCTSFLSLLPNYQQEPSQGNALHKPTLERENPTKTTSSNSK